MDVVRRPRDVWIVDFGSEMSLAEASLYDAPFRHIQTFVYPVREMNRRETRRRLWWRHGDGQPRMRRAISTLSRYIVTPEVAKHRVFRWAHFAVLPDCKLMVIASDEELAFGVLQSRFHEIWSLRLGGWHGAGNDPRYSPSTTFETFPFPERMTLGNPQLGYQDDPMAMQIAHTARRLNDFREAWLNPPDLVNRVPEVVPGYPDRLLPKDDAAAKVLKTRTLTNLYNERPAWLANAHRDLDAAVAAAYGWPVDITDEEALARLFDLNQRRAAAPRAPSKREMHSSARSVVDHAR